MSDDGTSKVLSAPLRDGRCPVCGGWVTIVQRDGGTWVHGDSDAGSAACNAILKVVNEDTIQCVARRLSFFGWEPKWCPGR